MHINFVYVLKCKNLIHCPFNQNIKLLQKKRAIKTHIHLALKTKRKAAFSSCSKKSNVFSNICKDYKAQRYEDL